MSLYDNRIKQEGVEISLDDSSLIQTARSSEVHPTTLAAVQRRVLMRVLKDHGTSRAVVVWRRLKLTFMQVEAGPFLAL